MTNFFVNLPLVFLYNHPEYLDLFLSHNICPELGIDAESMGLPGTEWHQKMSGTFRSRNLNVSIHMPFNDLKPGSLDEYVRQASARRLTEGAMLGEIYHPEHFIIHSGYCPDVYDDNFEKWLEKSVLTWKKVLEIIPEAPVYLENVYEIDPKRIFDLLIRFEGRVGFCFDLGHWFSTGKGSENKNLEHWLEVMAPFLKHVHLHDNDGVKDEHLGMGAGKIPFALFFAELETLGIAPTFTLEPHTREDFKQSLDFVLEHDNWFSLLGLNEKDFAKLKMIFSSI